MATPPELNAPAALSFILSGGTSSGGTSASTLAAQLLALVDSNHH
jgi:hypothetical protein